MGQGMTPWWKEPFFQIAVPIIVTFIVATWNQNRNFTSIDKRIDDLKDYMKWRFDVVDESLKEVKADLREIKKRVDGLELRAWH